MKRVFNFSPGPATLPVSVLEEASRGVLEINGSGKSVLEVSHRGKDYEAIHFEARDRLLKLMGLDASEYVALFLGGGASLQFAMLPMNFLETGASADYVHTGEWSGKGIQEARKFGGVNVVATSESKKFSELPPIPAPTSGARYFHITTNNTIEGTQFAHLPETGDVPLVADASSDLLCRQLDHRRFAMVYAGAQKNLGPAGVTIVVMRKSFLAQASEGAAPAILRYATHAKADSLYHTPPVFPIYVVGLVLKWMEAQGGVAALEKINRRKAAAIYSALDEFPDFYQPAVTNVADRSLMNVTFRLRDPSGDERFLAQAQERGLEGLKGYRTVGGFRASIYNAFPEEGAIRLAEFLREFARKS